jgi:hypothetical protein
MRKNLLFTLVLMLAAYVGAMAQITTASLTGKVVGAKSGNSGAIEELPGANIVATHVPSGSNYGTLSQADGRFVIQGMRVGGPYTVKVSFVGYKEQVFEGVFLNLGTSANLNVSLVDESTQLQEVVVSGNRNDIFSADRTGAAASFDRNTINSLPTIGRTINDIVKYNAYSNGQSFAGQDARLNNFTVDGAVFNNGFGLGGSAQAGGRTGTAPISLDAFDELQVNVAPFDVRQSGFAGAALNAVTRSGTNEFTGSVYLLSRNNDLTGKTADGKNLAPFTIDESTQGFRFGAPIIKNKLFIFANYEAFKSSTPALTFLPAGSGATENVSRTTLADLQDVANFTKTNLGWEPGELFGFNNQINSKKGLVRLDYNINDNHKLAVRYSHHDSDAEVAISNSNSSTTAGLVGNRQGYASAGYAGNLSLAPQNTGYIIQDNTRSVAVELNSNFGGKFSNKLIGTYNYQNEDRVYRTPEFPTIDILTGVTFPGGVATGGSTYTSVGFDPFTPSNQLRYSTFNLTDNFTYYSGKHIITGGVAYEKYKSDNLFFPSSNGVYTYNSIADYKAAVTDFKNNPTAATSPVPVRQYNLRYSLLPSGAQPWQYLDVTTYSFYAQDEFQATDKFKLTFGVRGDLFQYDDATAKDFTNPVVSGLTFKDEYGKDYKVNTGAFPSAKLLLSPRIGFNYDLNGDQKTQIRGGAGYFVSRIPQVLVSNQLGNNGVNTAVITLTNQNVPFRTNPSDLPAAFRPPATTDLTKLLPYAINASDPDLKYPTVLKVNAAVDQKLPFGLIGTVEVLYNKNIQALRYIDANLKAPNRSFTGPDNRDRFPASGVVSSGSGAANTINVARFYNTAVTNVFVLKNYQRGDSYTFTFKLEKPAVKGFGGMLAYTTGQARDIQSVGSTVQANAPTNSGQNYLETSFADNDLRHRIIGYANYRLNYNLFGNFSASTMFTLGVSSTSGRKLSYLTQDLNGDGQTNDLIYVPNSASELSFSPLTVGSGASAVTYSSVDQVAAFEKFISGNEYLNSRRGQYAERNGAALPWLSNWDLSVVQEFYYKNGANGKRHTIQVRADILNFGNLINDKWGVNWVATSATPLALASVDATGRPFYRLATQTISNPDGTNSTILLRDSYVKSIAVGSVWQAQLGLRYTFN